MDLGWKGFLQCLEEWLDEVPLGAPHVDDDSKATFAHVLTVGRLEVRHGHSGQWRLWSMQSKRKQKPTFLFIQTTLPTTCQVSWLPSNPTQNILPQKTFLDQPHLTEGILTCPSTWQITQPSLQATVLVGMLISQYSQLHLVFFQFFSSSRVWDESCFPNLNISSLKTGTLLLLNLRWKVLGMSADPCAYIKASTDALYH